jgi:hemerythrin
MKASEIRTELLQQHADLRAQVEEIKRSLTSEPTSSAREALRALLVRLAGAVRRHNRKEEDLLRDVLPTVDAWGPARTEIMLEEHVKEHETIYAALVDAGTAEDVRGRVGELLSRMLEHMAHEEESILTEEVLTDEAIVRDYFGG